MAWFSSYSRRSRGFFFDNVFKSFSLGGTTVAEETTNDDATTEVKTTNNLSAEVMANITSVGTLGNVTVTNKITGGNIEISGNDIKNVQSGQNLVLSADGGNVVINDNFTVNNNTIISGNLTVNGTTTTVNSTNTTIADPLYILNNGQTGSPTKDSGFVVERGSATNVAFIWDESTDQFVAISTSEDGTTSGDVGITAYADLQVNAFTADTIAGNLTTGSQTGITAVGTLSSLTVTGNVTGGNILSNTIKSSSGNLTLLAPSGSHVKVSNTSPLVLDYVSDTHIFYSNAGELEGSGGLTYNGTELYADNGNIGGYLTVTGNITTSGSFIGDGSQLTGLPPTYSNSNVATYLETATGDVQTGNLTVSASSTIEFNENRLGNVGTPVAGADAATKSYVDGQLSAFNGDTFSSLAVSGETTITASGATTLNLAAGTGTAITTDNITKTVTIAIQESIFDGLDNQDISLITESITQEEDLGLITESVTKSSDLGGVVALEGVASPSQLILPDYEAGSEPNANPEGQIIYQSGAIKLSDGNTWQSISVNTSLLVEQTSTTGSAYLPRGTTAQRDGSPSAGYIRFNTEEESFEGYNGSEWGAIGGGASADGAIYENTNTISESYTLTSGTNGMSVGPITLASGVSVTVPPGQRWVIL